MIIEAGLVLFTGYMLNSFALFVHTKLKIPPTSKISLPKATSNEEVTPDDEPIEDTPEIPLLKATSDDEVKYVGLLNVKELKAYARELGLGGYGKLNKSDLQSFIVEHLNNV